jgi:hypothetical protein
VRPLRGENEVHEGDQLRSSEQPWGRHAIRHVCYLFVLGLPACYLTINKMPSQDDGSLLAHPSLLFKLISLVWQVEREVHIYITYMCISLCHISMCVYMAFR